MLQLFHSLSMHMLLVYLLSLQFFQCPVHNTQRLKTQEVFSTTEGAARAQADLKRIHGNSPLLVMQLDIAPPYSRRYTAMMSPAPHLALMQLQRVPYTSAPPSIALSIKPRSACSVEQHPWRQLIPRVLTQSPPCSQLKILASSCCSLSS